MHFLRTTAVFEIAGRKFGVAGRHGSFRLFDELGVDRGLLLCLIIRLDARSNRTAIERKAEDE